MGFSRVKVYEDDKTWAWKFILRILAILFNITGIALTASALSTSSAPGFEEGDSYNGNDIFFIPWNFITVSANSLCTTFHESFLKKANHRLHTVRPFHNLVPHKRLRPPLKITPHTSRRKRRLRPLSLALIPRHRVLLHHRSYQRSIFQAQFS